MIQWRALWAMARKNLRKAWVRHTVLAVVLTLAIAGDVLLGLFFAGLEGRAGSLAPATDNSLPMLVLAPDGVNVEAWVSWAARAGGFYSARNYDEAYMIAWREYGSASGRTTVLAVDFTMPQLSRLPLEGRWPFERDEIALPRSSAASLGATVGSSVQLRDPATGAAESFRVTGIFRAEIGSGTRPTALPTALPDPSLDFPMVALYPGSSEASRWPTNATYILMRAANAAVLEQRMMGYYAREHPVQPAMARFAVTEPVFVRGDLGPELGGLLGRLIFSPGRRALAASFVFIGTGIFVVLLIAFIERKRELAVLKTVGMNNNMVLTMVLMELGAVAAVALVVGSLTAVLAGGAVANAVEYVPPPTLKAWVWAVAHTAIVLVLATSLPLSMMRLATVQQLLQNERLYIHSKRVTLS